MVRFVSCSYAVDPDSKGGIYLQPGDFEINGFSLSKANQEQLLGKLKKQYINTKHTDVVRTRNSECRFYVRAFIRKVISSGSII